METEKNLHASVPSALLAKALRAASAENISVDEWLQDAMEQRLRSQRRQELYAYGEGQARKLGIKEEDVDRIIHEFRKEEREGKYPENGR